MVFRIVDCLILAGSTTKNQVRLLSISHASQYAPKTTNANSASIHCGVSAGNRYQNTIAASTPIALSDQIIEVIITYFICGAHSVIEWNDAVNRGF